LAPFFRTAPRFGDCAITRPLRACDLLFVTFPRRQCALRSLDFAFFSVSFLRLGTLQLRGGVIGTGSEWFSGTVVSDVVVPPPAVPPGAGIAIIVIERGANVPLNPAAETG
jgi:hypothetical protein